MTVRRTLKRLYWGMERRIVPGLEYSQHRYEDYLRKWVPQGAEWLDVGCGRRLLPSWRVAGERELLARAKSVVGIDLDLDSLKNNVSANVRIFGGVGALPFRDASFDVVTANMVVEHLDNPQSSFAEITRVLRHGGVFLFHTPNAKAFPTSLARRLPDAVKAPLARVLDNRHSSDVFRTYYRCNTAGDIARSAQSAGLEPVEISFVSSTALFAVVPPLALLELLWLRAIQRDSHQQLRSNILAVLRKC